MEDGAGYPSGMGPAEPTANADQLSTTSRDGHSAKDNDNSTARHLKSFTKRVLKKVNSLLLRQPPKQTSLAKPVLLLRSKRLTAQSLSLVPVSKRGMALIVQRMSLATGLSTPSVSEKKA